MNQHITNSSSRSKISISPIAAISIGIAAIIIGAVIASIVIIPGKANASETAVQDVVAVFQPVAVAVDVEVTPVNMEVAVVAPVADPVFAVVHLAPPAVPAVVPGLAVL